MVAYEIFQFTQDQVPGLSSPSLPLCKKNKSGNAGRPTRTCQIICLYLRPLVVTVMHRDDASQQFVGALTVITHMMAQCDKGGHQRGR